MLVVNRFRVAEVEGESFAGELTAARDLLAARPGFLEGTVGRNVDDPELWVLTTRWENAGSYRRALGWYDVRVSAWPVLSRAIEEPSAFEIVENDTELNRNDARHL